MKIHLEKKGDNVNIWEIILVLFLVLCAVDTIFYAMADFEGRTSNCFYKLPLGGITALIKFGRDK